MRLDSVRELKATLLSSLVSPLPTKANGRALAFAAREVSATSGVHRTVALGVASSSPTDFRLAVRVQRAELLAGPEVEAIRSRAKGEVDVRYIGRVFKQAVPWYQQRTRPLRSGLSLGHYKITAGTLGCFVVNRADASVLMLSNNHVLANENDAEEGDAILQAGQVDGGRRPGDVVGRLGRFVRLKKAGRNVADCAVASVAPSVPIVLGSLRGIGKLAGLGPEAPAVESGVAKVGRTTGVRRGRVTAFELDNVVIGYDLGDVSFDDQIEIEGVGDRAFSAGGDSGSLVVDEDRLAVGLLFAGGDQGGANGAGLTYANPIRTVLDLLRVDLAF